MNTNYDLVNREIIDITTKAPSYKKQEYKLVFRNKDDDINMRNLDSIEWQCDFNKTMDHVVITTYMGAGDFAYDVFNNKDNIEVTINTFRDDVLYNSKTYKALLVTVGNNSAGINANLDRATLNKTGMNRVVFQLLEQEMEIIRALKISGIFKKTNVKSFLLSAFYNNLSNVKIRNSKINPTINIVTPDNENVYDHIPVPTGTRLIELPTFLQDTEYGVYKGDIGVYFKTITNNKVNILNTFIYPLYTKTPPKEGKELIIYYAPTQFSKMNNSNYAVTNENVKIVASELNILEFKENILMDKGGSITATNPETFLYYNDNIKNNKLTYDKDKVLTSVTYGTKDGLRNERYVGSEANLFKHISKVMADSLDLVKVRWKFSDHTLLRPGMFTKVYYQNGRNVKVMQGVLQEYYTLYHQMSKIEETIMLFKLGEVNE